MRRTITITALLGIFALGLIGFSQDSFANHGPTGGHCDDPAGPGVDWSGCDKRGEYLNFVDLSGANLSGTNISGVDLEGANLSGANLSNADLSGSYIDGSDLSNTDLSNANFSGAIIWWVDFTGANLTGANFSNANIRAVDLSFRDLTVVIFGCPSNCADLDNTNLSGSNLSGVDLSNADVSYANLSGANLTSTNFSGADLTSANLSGANLTSTNFSGADLTSANLSGVDLTVVIFGCPSNCANLSGADLTSANLSGADLTGADFTGADLTNTDLTGANLSRTLVDGQTILLGTIFDGVTTDCSYIENNAFLLDCDLSGMNLSGARLQEALLINANLSGADLTSADLTDANLSVADLTGANLSGADLSDGPDSEWELGANLSNADLTDADLTEANLRNANITGTNFSNADLYRTNLNGQDLSVAFWGCPSNCAVFNLTYLSPSGLSGVNLSNSYFRVVIPEGTGLSGVNLSGADFYAIFEYDTFIIDSNLSGADLSRMEVNTRLRIQDSNLSNVNLADVWFEGVSFTNVDLSGADLSYSYFYQTTISGNLSGANLNGAEFDESRVEGDLHCYNHPVCIPDNDGDLVHEDTDPDDNNPCVPDPSGDACLNSDTDGDGVLNGVDNCMSIANSGQADSDGDGYGDACDGIQIGNIIFQITSPLGDPPLDFKIGRDVTASAIFTATETTTGHAEIRVLEDFGPGIPRPIIHSCIGDDFTLIQNWSVTLSCTFINYEEGNFVLDYAVFNELGSHDIGKKFTVGDPDGDGVFHSQDNCPGVANSGQEDTDGNETGDACNDHEDTDGDEYANNLDNCPDVANADQINTDGDTQGNACDLNDDNDHIPDSLDTQPLVVSNDISDDNSPIPATGTIVAIDPDMSLLFIDLDAPLGIAIQAFGLYGHETATISTCDGKSIETLTDEDWLEITCSSAIINVINGPIDVQFIGDDETIATVTLETGANVKFDNEVFSLINNGTVDVLVEVGETLIPVGVGQTVELNVAPDITSFSSVIDPTPINTSIDATVEFTDPNLGDTHTVVIEWGDSTSDSIPIAVGSRSLTVPHTYHDASIYTPTVTVTDDSGDYDSAEFEFIIIYDPTGGFVTGGGWIHSPLEAYSADPTLEGKATFGFVSKYKKGADTPTGETEFQFKVADLNFHSDVYDWLVVANAKAMYKGTGTISGLDGNYGFMLSAIDANETPNSGDKDTFRIKIWDENEMVVYDNQLGDLEDADPTTEISGGSIVVHTPKGK